ncbi:MAG TPA: hypothetical protein VMV04_25170 [Thermodesulfobacteriota bacterium]|nr:hypothetical protein [Thermodesulfobacteriota bacterium]
MLTLFAVPKQFQGPMDVIQRNAIRSWTLLRPRPEIILFGDEEGTAEAAKEFGVGHVAKIERNEYGTPLVNDLFESAQRLARHEVLCYVNADIILMSDFTEAVRRVVDWVRRFLIIGQRWDTEIKEPLDFSADWESNLRSLAIGQGKLHSPTGIDFFVFSRGIWNEIPPLALGRTTWDNWLIYRARSGRIPVIDATEVVTAVHQDHDYRHVPSNAGDAWKGPEAKRNWELAGGVGHVFNSQDATHVLTHRGIRRALDRAHIVRLIKTTPQLYSPLNPLFMIVRAFVLIPALAKAAFWKITTTGRKQ